MFKALSAQKYTFFVPRRLRDLFVDEAPAADAAAPAAGAAAAAAPAAPSVDAGFWAEVKPSLLEVLALVHAVILAGIFLATNHWTLSNAFGVAFALQGLSMISLGSVQNGLIMLWGLFIYDITWVFGSDVMVTVAKKFDAPIKLLFHRGEGLRPSMLGLGDIVIPGIFIALMLRLDRHIAETRAPGSTRAHKFPKPYFHSVMVGYWLGLSITLAVMYWFEHAQPALLYLVPTCNGAVAVCALWRGEFSMWFKFEEDAPAAEAIALAPTAAAAATSEMVASVAPAVTETVKSAKKKSSKAE